MAHYDRVEKGDPDKTYDFLVKSIRKFLERKRHRQNRQDMVKALSGGQVRPRGCRVQRPIPGQVPNAVLLLPEGHMQEREGLPLFP